MTPGSDPEGIGVGYRRISTGFEGGTCSLPTNKRLPSSDSLVPLLEDDVTKQLYARVILLDSCSVVTAMWTLLVTL